MTTPVQTDNEPLDSSPQATKGTDIRLIAAGLYVATLILEGFGVFARWVLISSFLWIVSGLARLLAALLILVQSWQQTFSSPGSAAYNGALQTGISATNFIVFVDNTISSFGPLFGWVITLGPPLASMLTLLPFVPGGFFLRRFALGAREPSRRENAIITSVLSQLQAASTSPLPAHYGAVYIIDKPGREAHVLGNTLYITAGLIDSTYLAPILAHELFHANSFDGRLVLALRRLVLFPVYLLSRTFGQVAPGAVRLGASASSEIGCVAGAFVWLFGLLLSLGGGGFGLWLMNLPWAWFWKQREYAADRYAAELGQKGNLIQYLEETKNLAQPTFDIAAPYLIIEPPAGELRQDRLETADVITTHVDLRPALVIGAAALAIFCGLPLLISGITAARFNIEGQSWYLTAACRSSNCTPMPVPSASRGEYTSLTFRDGRFTLTEFSNGQAYQQTGTYTRSDTNHIFVGEQYSGQIANPLSGTYEIQRTLSTLTLVGRSNTNQYSAELASSEVTEPPLVTSGPQDPVSELYGTWVSSDGKKLTFYKGGTCNFDGDRGTYTIEGNTLHMKINEQSTDGGFSISNGELTLSAIGDPSQPITTFTREQ